MDNKNMDLSTLSPEILASLATALQQGTSPTELLSQILHQNVDVSPPLAEAEAPSETQEEVPLSSTEAPSETQEEVPLSSTEAPSEAPVPPSETQEDDAPVPPSETQEDAPVPPSETQEDAPVPPPHAEAEAPSEAPLPPKSPVPPPEPIISLPVSQVSQAPPIVQPPAPQRYLSLAELRARHRINGHFYNASDASTPPAPVVSNFNPHFPRAPLAQPQPVLPPFVPLEVKPSTPAENEFQAFVQASRFHRANGVSMPYMTDEAMYKITKQNLQRPLTKPFHREAAVKQMKATQDMIDKFINAKTEVEPTPTYVYNVRTRRHEVLLENSNPPPVDPRTLSQNRLKQLQERRQAQLVARASMPMGAHRQLQDRAAQLKQYLASKK